MNNLVRLQVTHKSHVKRLQMRIAKIVILVIITLDSRVAQQGQLLKCLSRCEGKLSCPVLRGRSGRKAGELPGVYKLIMKELNMKNTILICTLLLVVACASTINYVPKSSESVLEAKLTIKQFLQQQPPQFVPNDVEITDNYFKMIKQSTRAGIWTYGITTVPIVTFVYYGNIGKINLYYKKGIYRIFVFDKDSNIVRCKVYSANENKAKGFIDALYTLQMNVENQ